MSYRRSISFAEHEIYLLDFFDKNGKSDIAKESMKFYLRHKDRITILPEGFNLSAHRPTNIDFKKIIK